MLPNSCYLKILQYVKMKARKINNFNSNSKVLFGHLNQTPATGSFNFLHKVDAESSSSYKEVQYHTLAPNMEMDPIEPAVLPV